MTYKEFNNWCNNRACDGMWGIKEAMYCAGICSDISNYSRFRFKREKKWKNDERRETAEKIVAETNMLIDKLKGRRKSEVQDVAEWTLCKDALPEKDGKYLVCKNLVLSDTVHGNTEDRELHEQP